MSLWQANYKVLEFLRRMLGSSLLLKVSWLQLKLNAGNGGYKCCIFIRTFNNDYVKKEAKNAVGNFRDKINNFTAFVDLLATLRFNLTRKRFLFCCYQ